MAAPRTYRIEHIADLLLIPADRLREALADIEMGMAAARLVLAACSAATGSKPHREILPSIDWTDDGKRVVTGTLRGGGVIEIRQEG